MGSGSVEGRPNAAIRRSETDWVSLPAAGREVNAAAFFDVDKTLIRGSTMYYLAVGLARRRYFSPRQLVDVAWKQGKFVLTGREHLGDVASIIEQAQSLVAGRRVDEIRALGEAIYVERIADKLWPQAIELVDSHLAQGRQVWIVTSTGQEIADMIASQLGITGAVGTCSEAVDGVYTGRLAGPPMHGPAKANAVQALAEEHLLDLASCYAYSDSVHDIPMLSQVGHPTAVNPDKDLLAHAEARRWPTLTFDSG